jgi:hypothetical protein
VRGLEPRGIRLRSFRSGLVGQRGTMATSLLFHVEHKESRHVDLEHWISFDSLEPWRPPVGWVQATRATCAVRFARIGRRALGLSRELACRSLQRRSLGGRAWRRESTLTNVEVKTLRLARWAHGAASGAFRKTSSPRQARGCPNEVPTLTSSCQFSRMPNLNSVQLIEEG